MERQAVEEGAGIEQPLAAHQRRHIDVSYLNISGTFYYLCSILNGCSRYIVNWDLRESMTEADIEIILDSSEPPPADQREIRTLHTVYSHFVRREILIVMALAVACGRRPGTFPPPTQKSLNLGPDPGRLKPFVYMDDPGVAEYIVRDISPEPGFRRWAFTRPELRFQVRDIPHPTLVAEFALPEVTYKVTGPVTVSGAVNGRDLGSIRCDHAGDWRLERPVPDGVIDPQQDVHVTFSANPRWVSPDDGAQLSFFLRGAGFTQ